MRIQLVEKFSNSEETLSDLYINNVWHCHALEDQAQLTKVPKETRIPEGSYKITLRKAGGFYQKYLLKWPSWIIKYLPDSTIRKFAGSLYLNNVPNFEYILIHIGNTDKDTDGCILVGTGYTESRGRFTILNSTETFTRFYYIVAGAILRGEEVYIDIIRKPKS